jgi:hypothetical protein
MFEANVNVPVGMTALQFILDLNEFVYTNSFKDISGWQKIFDDAVKNLDNNNILCTDFRNITFCFRLSNENDANILNEIWK